MPSRKDITVDIDKVTIDTDRALLNGKTDSFEAVDRLRESLEQAKLFKSVAIGNRTKGIKGEIKFSLSIDMSKESDEEL